MEVSIKIRRLCFQYGNTFDLNIEKLDINPGELTVILGPNGSGKTTLFSLLRGRLKALSGSIEVCGKELVKLKDSKRAALVGLVPQRTESAFSYTVSQMVSMGFYRKSRSLWHNPVNESQVLALLERLDLRELKDRTVNSLSGGEYQRVLLARVLAQDPEVLLLDEPSNHLDLHHQEELLKLLAEEAKGGKTVIAILHDINQALLHADKVILLDNGKCCASGKAEDVVSPDNIEQVYKSPLEYYRNASGSQSLLGPKR